MTPATTPLRRALPLLAGAALLLSACGGPTPAAGSAPAPEEGPAAIAVGYSLPLPDPTYETLLAGVTADIEAAGGSVRSANAQFDPGKQISDIDSLVTQGVDVLIVGPLDPRAVRPALDRARAAGIEVIVQEGTAGPDAYGDVATTTFTRNADAARAAAEYLAEQVPDGAVGVLAGPPVADVLVDRNTGFDEGAAAAGLTVLDRQEGNPQQPDVSGRQITDAWRTRFGAQMQGVLSYNDETAVGVASAVQGDFRPTIVSINGSEAGVELVRSGAVAATWSLVPAEYSHLLAWAAQEAAAGRELPPVINIEMPRIDAGNVAAWTPPRERIGRPFTVELADRGGEAYLVLPDDAL